MNVLVNKIMESMAKTQFGPTSIQNPEQFNNCVSTLTKMHARNIRGMTSAILERIFISHVEQNKVHEIKRLIYSSMFLKSVFLCACEIQFYIYNVKDMQVYTLIELVDQPPFDFWRILNIFLKLYRDIPSKLNN